MDPLRDLIRRYLADEPYRRLTDDDLWARFRDHREEGALRVLLERLGGPISARCRAVLRDDAAAEDAFQEALVALVRHRAKLPTHRAAVAWLYETATNKACKLDRSRRRSARREALRAAATPEAVPDRAPEETARRDESAALNAALLRLPDRQRRAVELVYLEGLTHDQAAEALGWSRGAVGTYVRRGLDRLRAILGKHGGAAAVGGAVALESALSTRAPAFPPERIADMAALVLAKAAAAPAEVGWLAARWKPATGAGLCAATVAGAAWWLDRPDPQPPPTTAATQPPAAPAETYQDRNLRLFRTEVQPRLVAALKPAVIGDGSVEVTNARAYDTRVACTVLLHHAPDGIPPLTSELSFDYDTRNGEIIPVFAFTRGGSSRKLDPDRPIILMHNPWGGPDLVMKSQPLTEALEAFKLLQPDERLPAESEKRWRAVERAMRPYLGDWYQYGDPALRCRVEQDPPSRNYIADAPAHKRGYVYIGDITLNDRGGFDGFAPFGKRGQLSPDGRRLDFAGGEWWTREPVGK